MHVVVRQLSKAYGLLWALRDVSVELQQGECVALLGPNGAGKTTFLKLLSALLRPTSGEIELDGERLAQGSQRLRSLIGFLTPHGHFYEDLTARENLKLFCSLYGKAMGSGAVERILDFVGLARWSDDYVGSLSSGMKCRLAIAKWLLLKPRLLLLDEPFGALDGSGVDLLENYIRELCRSGGTVVMATHHVARVLGLCSRALILHQGRLIFDEPREEPWESFQRAFREFLPSKERWTS